MSLKFVNLHGHDNGSIYDAIGSPKVHGDWMLKNAGEDSGALAITNHGNMNTIGSIVAAQKEYNKKDIPVKFLYGVETYFLPSISEWHTLKQQRDLERKEEKKRKKTKSESEFVIENEEESKFKKTYDLVNRRNHLVLVAINQEGLKNLFRLVSKSYRKGFYRKPRIDLSMLKKYNKGIIASSACLAGIPTWCSFYPTAEKNKKEIFNLYNKELFPLMEIFGKNRFFLELQFNRIPEQKIVNKHIIEYSKRTGYDLIVTADSHYPNPQMFRDREIYRLLGYQMQKSKDIDLSILEKNIDEMEAELYLKNGDQIYESYKETFYDVCKDERLIVDAIERTFDIAHNLIGSVIPDDEIKLPKTFQITEKLKTPFDKLKQLCLAALKEKKLSSKNYIDRTVYELKIIKQLGVEEYFLTKREIINILKKYMLIGPARGSSAGSMVCYLLGITMIDPIKNNLLFERFMSLSRAEMPDIDSDVELKEEVLDILKDHFGEENVLAITNYNRLQLKSLIKDISRLYGISYEKVNAVTKIIENESKDFIMKDVGYDQKLYEFTFEKAKQYSKTLQKFLKEYPKVETHIENLYQEKKSLGRHAGGVLIVPDAESCLPIIRTRGVDQSPITEGITAQHLKHFGLIKFDVLGLSTLGIIRKCIEGILKENEMKNPMIDDVWNFYNKNLHPDVLNLADQKVFKTVYHSGKWPSIFQFAEKGVQSFCSKAKPKHINDISAITSIWRPGPLSDNGHEKYIWAIEPDKIKEFKREHLIIQEVLGNTRGILVFQEHFMELANKLAGFTLEEADNLRKLLVKPATSLAKEIKKERREAGKKFIDGCIKKGLSKTRAEKLWNKEIITFLNYGFNKSHAISYSYNSYQCAWLYTYYPNHWVKACLEKDPDLEKTINTVRSLGYFILKPDINLSYANNWQITNNNQCIPSLISLKGIGLTAANELENNRNKNNNSFKDIYDFFFHKDGYWRWSKLNKKTLQILIKMEALSSLNCIGKNKLFKNYKHLDNVLFSDNNFEKIKKKKINLEDIIYDFYCDDWTTIEKINFQKEISGFYDKNLIIGEYLPTLQEFGFKGIDETEDDGNKIQVWGIVEDVIQKTTRTKKSYLVVSVTGMSEKLYYFKVWDDSLSTTKFWKKGNVVIFSLNYSEEWGYNLYRNAKIMKLTK